MYEYTTISFPGLGLEFNPARMLELGPLKIHFYGVIIALGLVLAVVYALRRREQFGLSEDDLMDGVLWIAPFAILCARIYYCAFEWDRYADNPISILYIWEGGIAIYGAVIGAAIGVILHCKVFKKISVLATLDLVALGFMIGQMMGRWGNFFNREAHGGVTDSFLRMGLLNPITGEGQYYHPTFLYESAWNLVGFVLLHFFSKKRRYDGQVALCYVAWYGLGRCFIEGLRTDSLWWGPFRVSQVLAAVSCLAAVTLLLLQSRREHKPEDLFVNKVAAKKAAEEAAEETAE
jgi:phosphatidylglycerol:prolipoprotein diacylglycerol transferase